MWVPDWIGDFGAACRVIPGHSVWFHGKKVGSGLGSLVGAWGVVRFQRGGAFSPLPLCAVGGYHWDLLGVPLFLNTLPPETVVAPWMVKHFTAQKNRPQISTDWLKANPPPSPIHYLGTDTQTLCW